MFELEGNEVVFSRLKQLLIILPSLLFVFWLSEIQVVCQADYIEVTLQTADYPGLIVNDSVLHLEDKACVAGYKDDSMVKFTFGLESCKTTMEDDGDKIYYMNNVYLQADETANDSAITRKHAGVIPFKCGYDKKTTISKVSYDPKSALVITDAGNLSNFMFFWNQTLELQQVLAELVDVHDPIEHFKLFF